MSRECDVCGEEREKGKKIPGYSTDTIFICDVCLKEVFRGEDEK